MHPALRSIAGQLGRRIILLAIAAGAAIAFFAVAGGTGAQTTQRVTIAPASTVNRTPGAVSSPPTDPTGTASTSTAPAQPPAASGNRALTKAAVRTSAAQSAQPSTPAAIEATTAAVAPTTRAHGRGTRGPSMRSNSPADPTTVTTAASADSHPAAAPNYQYSGVRDVAAVINPQRAANGWGAVTTTAATASAGCVTAGTCSGQVGACGFTPTSIGTANTSVVYDGQYKDQYGHCRELVSF